MFHNLEFVTVDVETTGLFPHRHDRVIEIAAIRTDWTGTVLDEFITLINPHRDLGPVGIHGIAARDVLSAPSFDEIVGDLLTVLHGAVFVAHNVGFDLRFVRSEIELSGYTLPAIPHLCTMQLAHRVNPELPCRRLEALCKCFGISINHCHCAEDDARATVHLLSRCLQHLDVGEPVPMAAIGIRGLSQNPTPWPKAPKSGKSYRREEATLDECAHGSYVGQLVSKLPAESSGNAELDAYLLLLDRVLEDRRVTDEEAHELLSVAASCGLGQEDVLQAHRQYLKELLRVALEDGAITDSEHDDLDNVRKLLSIPHEDYQSLLRDTDSNHIEDDVTRHFTQCRDHLQGKRICFTGAFVSRINGTPATRALAQRLAAEKGMILLKGVTKKLDYLVTTDPYSMSGKAKKAREYGIRVIAEPVFWQMMGIRVD